MAARARPSHRPNSVYYPWFENLHRRSRLKSVSCAEPGTHGISLAGISARRSLRSHSSKRDKLLVRFAGAISPSTKAFDQGVDSCHTLTIRARLPFTSERCGLAGSRNCSYINSEDSGNKYACCVINQVLRCPKLCATWYGSS